MTGNETSSLIYFNFQFTDEIINKDCSIQGVQFLSTSPDIHPFISTGVLDGISSITIWKIASLDECTFLPDFDVCSRHGCTNVKEILGISEAFPPCCSHTVQILELQHTSQTFHVYPRPLTLTSGGFFGLFNIDDL